MKKQRIVIKIGSSLLTMKKTGALSLTKLFGHVEAISNAYKAGHEIILVTSGAVAAGFSKLGLSKKPSEIVQKQASAAIGQQLLMQAYTEAFEKDGITTAQILITKKDLALRESYNYALNTLTYLIDKGVIPIINQNDTTAFGEFSYTDNDTLAVRIAALLHADLCIIFTDTAGLYDSDPNLNPNAKKINLVTDVTDDIIALTGDSQSNVGTGGMRSKVLAAKLALELGTNVYIGDGRDVTDDEKILRILSKKGDGTYFNGPKCSHAKRKQQWIALHATPEGTLIIDNGAKNALLKNKKSLLYVGIKQVFGHFEQGSVVEVQDEDYSPIGRGIVKYTSGDLRKFLAGRKKSSSPEVIHYDDWVAMRK